MKQCLSFFVCILFFHCYGQKETSSYKQSLPETDLSITFREIPAGVLTTPSSEEITIEPFWMSDREITWGLYKLFLQREIDHASSPEGSDVSLTVDAVSGATIPYVDMSLGMGTDQNLPVGNVTWLAATRFCQWLSALTGHFYRLPTAAEWQYAARAESTSKYSFGNDVSKLANYAWYTDNSEQKYQPVATKEPNNWGLYDMHGNVAEWTLTQYSENGITEENSLIVAQNEYPIAIVGGSFQDSAENVQSNAYMPSKPVWKQRDPQFPKSKWWFTDAPFVGFRIVRPATPPKKEDYSHYWPESIN